MNLCIYNLISSIDIYFLLDDDEKFEDANGAEGNGNASESGGNEHFLNCTNQTKDLYSK